MKILTPSCITAISMLCLGSGCNQKSDENCAKAQSVIRQSLASKAFEGLAQWREYAYKHCSDRSVLAQLDQEIVTQQSQAAAAKQVAAQAEQQKQQMLGLFQQWVVSARSAPDRAAGTPVCEGDEKSETARSKERFCNGNRPLTGAAGSAFLVRYWEKQPAEAARYSVRLATPTQCSALGANRVVKVIAAPATNGATVNRYYCELTGGPLSGLFALASEANNADLYVFTAKYLEHDASFAAILK